jgi:xanthine/CO dehydrogenase XdhC/CoxF family maturation factor/CTP:molybdopterin cytidylyltransferase MocA
MIMTEFEEVLAGVQQLWKQGQPAAVATVVRVCGSAYRRPGARMLVAPGGTRRTGMISGGCLEGDVARKAWALTAEASAALLRYDSTADEEGTWDLGLGCNGIVEILVERLSPGDVFVEFARDCLTAGKSAVVSTVFRAEEGGGMGVGSKVLTDKAGSRAAEITTTETVEMIAAGARRCLASGRTHWAAYVVNGARIEVLHEYIEPAPRIVIFGAGWDAVPVVEAAASLGWNVTVVDRKASRAVPSRFPRAKEVLVVDPDDLRHSLSIDAKTAAVIMSHDYQDDLAYLDFAMRRSAWFVGVLGPARRRDRLLADLREQTGAPLSPQQSARLYAPIGLDVGAETPQEIAVSIISEVVAARAGRPGSMLREKDGPIHDISEPLVGLVVLAAGASTRMGELGPKQLLPLGGKTLVGHAVQTAVAAAIGPVVVVLGANAERMRAQIADFPVHAAVNDRWHEGIGTSIRTGISALLHQPDGTHLRGAIIMTADQPLLSRSVLHALVEAHERTARPIAAAEYAGTVGTPALFARELFEELLSLMPEGGAKQLIALDATRVTRVPFAGGERDVDTPADYQCALAALDHID